MDDLQAIFTKLYLGQSASRDETKRLVNQIIEGKMDDVSIAGMLIAMKIRQETVDEISGAADALLAAAKPFPLLNDELRAQGIIDIVGTGGDGHNTINISTTAAFVAAAAGAKVAKHGNRSVSSKSGSSDLLAQLGIDIAMSPTTAKNCLEQLGLCFLFAPQYHTGVRHVATVRQKLKTRTIFNVLGPLINPSRPDFIVIGVYSATLVEPVAKVLRALGMRRAMVVHGSGLDEVAVHDNTLVCELNGDKLQQYQLSPAKLGVAQANLCQLKGGTPKENAAISTAILQGNGQQAHNHAVAVNAGCALYICGLADNPKEGTQIALDTLKSGKAYQLLLQLIDASKTCKKDQ